MRRHLARRSVAEPDVEHAVAVLERDGYLDDATYARRFAEDRRALDGWGSERIERDLLARGIAPEVIAAACGGRSHEDELDAALAVLRRRIGRAPADERGRQRALSVLVRRGYELDLAYDAVRRFEATA